MIEKDYDAEAIRLGLPLTMKSKRACAVISCGGTKLRELIHEGKIEGVKRGKDLLIRTSSVLRYNASLPPAQFTLPPKRSSSAAA